MTHTKEQVYQAIEHAWASTTTKSHRWSPENPAYGQSDVTALAIHDFVGGAIVRRMAILPYGESAYHYSNIVDGEPVDLTAGQYVDGVEFKGEPEPIDRAAFDKAHPVSQRLDTLKHYMSLYLPDHR